MAELLLTDGHRISNNLFMDYAVFATAMKQEKNLYSTVGRIG